MGYSRLPYEIIENMMSDYDVYRNFIRPKSSQYVDKSIKGRYAGLLWIEVLHIQFTCNLTTDEAMAWGTYLDGYDNETGAEARNWEQSFYELELNCAMIKANRYQYAGVITTILEELGWQAKSYSETLDFTANVEPKYGTWSRVSKRQQLTSAERVFSNRSTGRFKGQAALHSAGTAARN